MKMEFVYDHYFDYYELTAALQKLAGMYPDLMKLESAGTTEEDKTIWSVTLSDDSLRPADKKPAFYMDGNTHAGEVSGSMACLHMIDHILSNHEEAEIAEMLKNQTFYFIPRISPDGVDEYLHTANTVRSINRIYPADQSENHGLKAKDLDDNGKIVMMRIKKPAGAWKKRDDSDFLMTKRQPDEKTGEFYNVYTEGMIDEFNGVNITMARPLYAMDFNRNFPVSWMPDAKQPGAGEYPLSMPETQAMANFIISHRNICAVLTMHTSGGALLHPPGMYSETQCDPEDMRMYKEIGALADHKLNYPTCNLFDAYCIDPKHFDAGAFDDWCFIAKGIPSFTMEIWNVKEKAGCGPQWPVRRDKKPAEIEEENRKVYEWLKENSPESILPWKEFEHPQLGTVEIGGIDYKFATQNPPCHLLNAEMEKILDFSMRYAKVLPDVGFANVKVIRRSDDVWQIDAVLMNTGFLPTWLSNETKKLKENRPIRLSLNGAEVLSGPEKIDGLGGFHNIRSGYSYGNNISTFNHEQAAAKLTWIVKANAGDTITLTACNERAGTADITVELK